MKKVIVQRDSRGFIESYRIGTETFKVRGNNVTSSLREHKHLEGGTKVLDIKVSFSGNISATYRVEGIPSTRTVIPMINRTPGEKEQELIDKLLLDHRLADKFKAEYLAEYLNPDIAIMADAKDWEMVQTNLQLQQRVCAEKEHRLAVKALQSNPDHIARLEEIQAAAREQIKALEEQAIAESLNQAIGGSAPENTAKTA